MVIDTSAIAAILFDEPSAPALESAIGDDPVRLISAATLLELGIVIEHRLGELGGRELDLLIHRAKVEVVAFNAEHAELARAAWRKYGKGRHRAGLNYGDCFSYALSISTGEPLLFVGSDFTHTDISPSVTF